MVRHGKEPVGTPGGPVGDSCGPVVRPGEKLDSAPISQEGPVAPISPEVPIKTSGNYY